MQDPRRSCRHRTYWRNIRGLGRGVTGNIPGRPTIHKVVSPGDPIDINNFATKIQARTDFRFHRFHINVG